MPCDIYEDEMWYCTNINSSMIGPCNISSLSQYMNDGVLSHSSMVRLAPSHWRTLASVVSPGGVWSLTERDLNKSKDEFGKSGVTLPPQAKLFWSYIDEMGHEQGPFDTEKMMDWNCQGHFPPSTMLRLWPHGWVRMSTFSRILTMAKEDEFVRGHTDNLPHSPAVSGWLELST